LNDEYPHLKYSLYLIEHKEFPINQRAFRLEDPAAWIFLDYEYGQAPLYYVLNVPFAATSHPMLLSRLFSVLLSSLTLWIAILCIEKILREKQTGTITAAVLMGFNPVFLRIGSSVSNDNLSWLISAILFWLFLEDPKLQKKWLWGILIGLGVLSKVSFLIWPLFLVLRFILFERDKQLAFRLSIAGCISIAIAGWWLIRSYTIYGDWSGISGGAGAPGEYLRSGSLYLIQDFPDTVVRFTFFPIAEETAKFLWMPQLFVVLFLTTFFLQFKTLREQFREGRVFTEFLLFHVINFAAFLYPNLVWPYADGRLLFIGFIPIAAMASAVLNQNFGKLAPVAALILNATYLIALW
jgi:4-amino-4-deoxy-L-arabinose transferase-like glycosyltransferase